MALATAVMAVKAAEADLLEEEAELVMLPQPLLVTTLLVVKPL